MRAIKLAGEEESAGRAADHELGKSCFSFCIIHAEPFSESKSEVESSGGTSLVKVFWNGKIGKGVFGQWFVFVAKKNAKSLIGIPNVHWHREKVTIIF